VGGADTSGGPQAAASPLALVAMTKRNLTRRLEELEKRIAPADAEPLIIQVTYVSPDGTSVPGPRYTYPPIRDPRRPWETPPVIEYESAQ
jgi:hypothetical protein